MHMSARQRAFARSRAANLRAPSDSRNARNFEHSASWRARAPCAASHPTPLHHPTGRGGSVRPVRTSWWPPPEGRACTAPDRCPTGARTPAPAARRAGGAKAAPSRYAIGAWHLVPRPLWGRGGTSLGKVKVGPGSMHGRSCIDSGRLRIDLWSFLGVGLGSTPASTPGCDRCLASCEGLT